MAKQLEILAPQFCKLEVWEVLPGMPVFCPLDRISERNELKVMEDLLWLMVLDHSHMGLFFTALCGGRVLWQGGSLCWRRSFSPTSWQPCFKRRIILIATPTSKPIMLRIHTCTSSLQKRETSWSKTFPLTIDEFWIKSSTHDLEPGFWVSYLLQVFTFFSSCTPSTISRL